MDFNEDPLNNGTSETSEFVLSRLDWLTLNLLNRLVFSSIQFPNLSATMLYIYWRRTEVRAYYGMGIYFS